MACRQRHELLAPAVEERIGADDERAGMQLDEGGESGVDLAFGAGLQDMELHPLRARRFLHVSHDALGSRIVRVHEQGDHPGLGNQLGKQLEPLGRQLACMMLTPVRLPPGRARLATRPAATGSPLDEDDRDRRGRAFRRQCRRRAADRHDHVDLAADEVGGQCRAADHSGPPPSGIRSPRFVPRRSRFRSVPGGTRPQTVQPGRATRR